MKDILCLDGTNLSLETLYSIPYENDFQIRTVQSLQMKPDKERFSLRKELMPIGDNDICIPKLLKAFTSCYGETFPAETGMIALILLLNESIKYKNNISSSLIDRIIELINHNACPCLHQMNNNELSSMCEFALVISGDDNTFCYYNNELVNTSTVFRKLKLQKYEFSLKEFAFITNLCLISTSLSILSLQKAKRLAKTADLCTAMHLEAIRGETGAFDRRLHELGRPYPNQIISAENIRRIIEGSEFTTEKARTAFGGDHGVRCQDAICIRAVPQTHGGVRDTIEWLEKNISIQLNSLACRINPLIGYSLDLMITSLADLGNISERRSFRLIDSHLSYGLPMNLAGENPGFNHGFPVIQASATAVLGELKLLTLPPASSIDSIRKAYHCTTFESAVKSIEAVSLLTKILAIEMYMSAQAMDLAKDKLREYKFGKGTEAALSEFRKYIEFTRVNRFAAPDMVESDRILDNGIVLKAVQKVIGELN